MLGSELFVTVLFIWRLDYCLHKILDESWDIKLSLAWKEKQANLLEGNLPFLLYDSVATLKVITVFLSTSAKFTPLSH